MSDATRKRYAPGGDLYRQLEIKYGKAGADLVYQASLRPESYAINEALTRLNYGPALETNTWKLFTDNMAQSLPSPQSTTNRVIAAAAVVALLYLLIKK